MTSEVLSEIRPEGNNEEKLSMFSQKRIAIVKKGVEERLALLPTVDPSIGTVQIHTDRPLCTDNTVVFSVWTKDVTLPDKKLPLSGRGIATYVLDIVDEPGYLVTPEFIEFIAKKCMHKDGVLRAKYRETMQLTPKGCHSLCDVIHITNNMMTLAARYIRSSPNYKNYGVLTVDGRETLNARLDNFIHTGRCDRVLSEHGLHGPCDEDAVNKILASYGMRPKVGRVHIGQGKWQRVILD